MDHSGRRRTLKIVHRGLLRPFVPLFTASNVPVRIRVRRSSVERRQVRRSSSSLEHVSGSSALRM